MDSSTSSAVDTARAYYDSDDADAFYAAIWGGEDIHIGIYDSEDESISGASRRTIERMATLLGALTPEHRVLDIGSGYGGAARHLARRYGCRVTGLNLSKVENQRARELNEAQGLAQLIDIVDGNFEALPFDAASFDVIWSQDAILHSGNRSKVFAEVARVAKPRARFVFTDPMKSDSCPDGVLAPILERIHLETLGSPEFYRRVGEQVGFALVRFEDLTEQLTTHYRRVLEETIHRRAELAPKISKDYIERMQHGLQHWIDGGARGRLAWGIFLFEKR
jgi:sarcosine/dimethylglycine N-methyltransferase